MERENVLATAGELITKDRADIYGPPKQSFGRIGALWGAMLGTEAIAPEMVALMLVQLKVSRIISSPSHEDSWVDLCGYGALGGELATEARPQAAVLPLAVGDVARVTEASGHAACVEQGPGIVRKVHETGATVTWFVGGEMAGHSGSFEEFERLDRYGNSEVRRG